MNRVLVVDDEEKIRKVLSVALREEGYEILQAEDGKTGASMARSEKPDLILLDVMLPDASGFDVCRSLKLDKDLEFIPVIMLTALGETGKIVQGLDAGADDYIAKPFDMKELLSRVRSHLRTKELYDETRKDEREKSALLEVAHSLSSSMEPQETLFAIVSKVAEVMEVTRCSILSVDPAAHEVRVMASHDSREVRSLELDMNKYPEIRAVVETGRPVVVPDALQDPMLRPVREALYAVNVKSMMAFPVIFQDALIGTLILRTSRRDKPFTGREIRFCGLISHLAAPPLKNAFQFQKLQRRVEEKKDALRSREKDLIRANHALQTLSAGNHVLAVAESEEELLNKMCEAIVQMGGYRFTWVGYAQHDDKKSVKPMAYQGFEEGYLERIRVLWADEEGGRGPTGTSIRTGRPCVVRNTRTDPTFTLWREEAVRRGYASSVGLPLIDKGKVFGALSIYGEEPDIFTEKEVRLLQDLANNLSYGIMALRARSDKEKMEEVLRKNRDSLARAQRIARLGNWDWNIASNELSWSDEIYRIFGLNPGGFGATYEAFLNCVHPEDREFVNRSVNEALREKKPYSLDHRIIRPDGEERTVHEEGEVQFNASGEPVRMIGTVQDITDRKKSEGALEQARKEIFTQTLFAQRLSALAAVSGGISHELSQPLSIIGLHAETIKAMIKKGRELERDYLLDNVEKTLEQVDRAVDIIDHMKEFSSGSQGYESGPLRLARLIQSVKKLFGAQLESHAINLKTEIREDLSILANRNRMEQVLVNLISNAKDAFMEKGFAPEGKKEIFIRGYGEDSWVILDVADTGPGVPESVRERLFEPFVTGKTARKGSGLGLSICQRILHDHGATIELHSTGREGTTFRIKFPLGK